MYAMANIILIEDHAWVRQAVTVYLAGKEHAVIATAESATEAQAVIAQHAADAQVVIVDLNLAHGEFGLPLVEWITETYPKLASVVFSMRENAETMSAAYRAGALAYVSKSADPAILLDAVNAAVKGERYFPPGVAEGLASLHAAGRGQNPTLILSERELQVFLLAAQGKPNDTIADTLALSPKRVANMVVDIKRKLNLERDGFMEVAVHYGLLALNL